MIKAFLSESPGCEKEKLADEGRRGNLNAKHQNSSVEVKVLQREMIIYDYISLFPSNFKYFLEDQQSCVSLLIVY